MVCDTCLASVVTNESPEIRYFDTITLMHKDTKVYLHSHTDKYPLRYEDGRISSNGIDLPSFLKEHDPNTIPRSASHWLSPR